MLDYALTRRPEFTKNEVFLAKDAHKESLVCLDAKLEPESWANIFTNAAPVWRGGSFLRRARAC
ncbi:MAG: hypothetical protein ABSB84_16190 [Verrucomicrobiota bacterium]|jgi:hypothetical protein